MTRARALPRAHWLWLAAFGLLGAALIARNLTALDRTPPGFYIDESSIAYNAWAIAHFGVDEHGVRLPLYFEAFGEYKNPIYIYAVVPLARLLPISVAVERAPAAVFGLVAALFFTLSAWRLTRSRPLTLFVLVLASLTPWLVQESRVGFEVISMVATLSVAFWCLADERALSATRFTVAGLFFALSIVAYSTGRLEILLFAAAFAFAYSRRAFNGWWRTLVLIAAGYAIVGVWALLHPGALTAEFNLISIAADGAPLPVLVARFIANYVTYFSPDFLFIHGDPNLRHNTGYAGMLLAISAPLVLLGIWACWQRRGQALPRLLLLCLLLGPVSASLTNNGGDPHALRAAVMLPVYFMLIAVGLDRARGVLRQRRVLAALMTAALVVQGGLYMLDLYTAYPERAAAAFDTGVPRAIAIASRRAAGHTVYLSTNLEQPYIQALFALLPAPPSQPVTDDLMPGLRELGMRLADPVAAEQAAVSGDVLVLAPGDPIPPGAALVDAEHGPAYPLAPSPLLVLVYRMAGPG